MSPRRETASCARRTVSSTSAEARAWASRRDRGPSPGPRSARAHRGPGLRTCAAIRPARIRLFGPFAHLPARTISRTPASRAPMLRETFVHIPGVGYRTEERLWRSGIRTWDDFAERSKPRRLPARVAHRIADEIARSDEALRRRRHQGNRVPGRDSAQ